MYVFDTNTQKNNTSPNGRPAKEKIIVATFLSILGTVVYIIAMQVHDIYLMHTTCDGWSCLLPLIFGTPVVVNPLVQVSQHEFIQLKNMVT